jgi:hypothetical protein
MPVDDNAIARAALAELGAPERVQQFNRVRSQLLTDCGDGPPSEAQEIIAHNAAALALWCEEQAAFLTAGGKVDIDQLGRTMNTCRRLLETLGIKRAPRDVTKFAEYLASKKASNESDSSE